MQAETEQVFFEEEQSFRQLWLWALLCGVLAILITAFVFTLQAPQHAKTQPALVGLGIGILVLSSVTLLMYAMKLCVRVDAEALRVKFSPLVKRDIALGQIARCEARTYRPLLEYGGWGVRCSRNGTAYNVSGNQGVQLHFTNGDRLLIGSQRPEELADAINQAKQLGR